MVSCNASCKACVCMLLPLVRHHVRHVYVLLPLVMPYISNIHLELHKSVSLKGRMTCIWSFGCGFTCATTMGCAGFELSFSIGIVL